LAWIPRIYFAFVCVLCGLCGKTEIFGLKGGGSRAAGVCLVRKRPG